MIRNSHRKRIINVSLGTATFLCLATSAAATDKHYGELFMMSGTYCPRDSMPADGRTLSIAQNSALYSLLGTKFGGNGRTDFALPNLIGRAPVGQGQGSGLTPRNIGDSDSGGRSDPTVKLPAHSHTIKTATSASRNTHDPSGAYISTYAPIVKPYGNVASGATLDRKFSAAALSETGDGSEYSINTQQPALSVSWCIMTHNASYPSRG